MSRVCSDGENPYEQHIILSKNQSSLSALRKGARILIAILGMYCQLQWKDNKTKTPIPATPIFYKGVLSHIAIWSPTIHLDVGWKLILEYLDKEMGQKLDDPKNLCIFEDFKGEQLDKIVAEQLQLSRRWKTRREVLACC